MKKVFLLTLFLAISCGDYKISKKPDTINIVDTEPTLPTFSCPTGYSLIPANYLNEEFCVMTFEAKNDGSGNPVSTNAGIPWVNIEINDAALACQSLGIKYDLISNQEWMSIARNIESVDENWNNGSVGDGSLFIGHTDNAPANLLSVSSTGDPYSDTGDTAPSLQKRLLYLSNGQSIWDFTGNANEWVDWDKNSLGVQGYYKNDFCAMAFEEFPGISCSGFDLLVDEYSPADTNLDSNNGVGKFKGAANNIPDPVAKRGGTYDLGLNAGIYTLNFESDRNDSYLNIGFRCVLRK